MSSAGLYCEDAFGESIPSSLYPYLGTGVSYNMANNEAPELVGATLSNGEIEKKLEFIEQLDALGVSKYIDLPKVLATHIMVLSFAR